MAWLLRVRSTCDLRVPYIRWPVATLHFYTDPPFPFQKALSALLVVVVETIH